MSIIWAIGYEDTWDHRDEILGVVSTEKDAIELVDKLESEKDEKIKHISYYRAEYQIVEREEGESIMALLQRVTGGRIL